MGASRPLCCVPVACRVACAITRRQARWARPRYRWIQGKDAEARNQAPMLCHRPWVRLFWGDAL